jgi:flagellar motor switch/type III secretory pathway protein FliN
LQSPFDVSDAFLDPAELEAIQAAIREAAPRRSRNSHQPDVEPTRLALIADDRMAEAARPILLGLANRWVRKADRALRSHLPGEWQVDVAGADLIDGSTAKDELRGGWVTGARVPAGDAELVFAAQGGIIEVAAAKRCGAAAPTSDPGRVPSAVSLRLFDPAGRAMVESWAQTWKELFDTELVPTTDLPIIERLIEARSVLRLSLTFSGAVMGRIQVYARPETLVPRPLTLAAHKAKTGAIANALANVPVDVVAELGTFRLRLSELRDLKPGSSYVLPSFVDSRVPVFCGGVLKAWARPVVSRGVLAVEIIAVVHGQGTKS